ncbi:hypothetical protein SEVIR_5G354150v4 [Setaria viridis]
MVVVAHEVLVDRGLLLQILRDEVTPPPRGLLKPHSDADDDPRDARAPGPIRAPHRAAPPRPAPPARRLDTLDTRSATAIPRRIPNQILQPLSPIPFPPAVLSSTASGGTPPHTVSRA